MTTRRFNIDISEDENGVVDVTLSNQQDFNTDIEYIDLVNKLANVFDLKDDDTLNRVPKI